MMGDKSGIEWTDATWNPIVGCSVVSPGCTNCYAMKMAARLEKALPATRTGGHLPNHYTDLTRRVNGKPVWTGRVTIAPDHVWTAPLKWRKPRRIFVNSMGDLFHEAVPNEWIDRVFAVMALSPQHTFQVLTKRSKRMRDYMTTCPSKMRMGAWEKAARETGHTLKWKVEQWLVGWPLPNVWLGVSAEDQARADERIPDLLATPAAVRFVSAEPLLSSIDFENIDYNLFLDNLRASPRPDPQSENWPQLKYDVLRGHMKGPDDTGLPKLDWIIAGGESGPGARPMHPGWPRAIRDQCAAAGVPFFFKQWGEWGPEIAPPVHDSYRWAITVNEPAGGVWSYKIGKARAGRLLDGIEHNAMPEVK